MNCRRFLGMSLAIAFVLAVSPAGSRADSVMLQTGGEIRGELSPESKGKKRGPALTIRTLSGATVVVDIAEVETVNPRRLLLEEYESLRRSTPDTLDAQWDLAEWCRQKSLPKEREVHLRQVIVHDPQHIGARRGLGHVRDKRTGEWTTQEEIMAARGYVKHKGKYVLPQQLDLIQEEERTSEAEKAWFKKVKTWHGWLTGTRPDRRNEALDQLKAINDATAIPALARTFKDEADQDQRMMYVEILTAMSGERPLAPLVMQSLWDESSDIRDAAIAGVVDHDVAKAIPMYLRALKNRANIVVNRAAAALEQIGDEKIIPQLVDALITRHVYTEMIAEAPVSVNVNGTTAQAGAQPVLPPSVQALLATGQLPYGVQVMAPMPAARVREVTYEKDEINENVLSALNKISGENFGFDKLTWKKWYNARKNQATSAKTQKANP